MEHATIMDISRQTNPTRRRYALYAIALGVISLGVIAAIQLRPVIAQVERQNILTGVVNRGVMDFQAHGVGTLVPVNVRYLVATSDSRIERILVWPGSAVKVGTLILELSNPEVQQAAQDAMWQVRAAEADFLSSKAKLESQLLEVKASVGAAKAAFLNGKMLAESRESLSRNGLVSSQELAQSRIALEELTNRHETEQQRLKIGEVSLNSQLATQAARVGQAKALYSLKKSLVDGLRVVSGMDGVLQQLPVQIGQRVPSGGLLAKVAQPSVLKAELKVNETQAKDIMLGQKVSVNTNNGLIDGRVIRVDPAVQNGTVTVDVGLEGELPKGVRPDQNVEGIIALDHADNTLFVNRPTQAQSNSLGTAFKIVSNDKAIRVKVRYGRGGVSKIEIVEGLNPGDQIVVSDVSQWDGLDRLKIK